MGWLFRIFRNLLALLAIVFILFIVYKNIPSINELNPFSKEESNESNFQGQHAQTTYTVEDNPLLQNVPLSQTKTAFKWINKGEFMDVSGLERMGYNDKYVIGQRGTEYILYKFGEPNMYVYLTEQDLYNDLKLMNEQITLKERSSF